MSLFSLIKKLPIDLGQSEMRRTTFGKTVALAAVPQGNGDAALDLGCADCFWTERVRARGWRVTAVDRNPACAGAAALDLDRPLPFSDGSFGLVWSTEVIAYLADPAAFKREALRVIRPGGTYVITTPNTGFFLDRVLKVFGGSLRNMQDPRQKHFFTNDTVRALFPQEQILGFFPYIGWKRRIIRFVGALSPTFIVVGRKKD